MFERFTDRALLVVALARDEAARSGCDLVDTEHLLLGLLRRPDSLAVTTLVSLHARIEGVREQLYGAIAAGQPTDTEGPGWSQAAVRVFELSQREVERLQQVQVDTEHLLLGLIAQEGGVAAEVLVSVGADLNRVRQEVLELAVAYPADAAGSAVRGYSPDPIVALLVAIEERVDDRQRRVSALEDAMRPD
ncbi:Clp protease N-terminal domain-containing protein [Sciscionella marina]|uniref:Clp protease N-terminal domain-containing protein n=1 Tax=Sciscionella marina TaxID=508770 RepID=UPI0003702535|nr:Clp protease N-terminal domain-containing protein [Sciscionella marina]